MSPSTSQQLISFAGALLILAAYIGHQMGWMSSRKTAYNVLNVLGSGILAYIAFRPFQLGFVVLESTWALVSLYAIVRSKARE